MSRTRGLGVLGVALTISVVALTASAQSLGEAAKKEKERRAKIQSKSTKVITDRELGTGAVPSVPAEGAAEPTEGQTPAAAAPATQAKPSAADESRTREHWQKRLQQKQQEIDAIQKQLQSPDANWGGGMRTDVNPLGQRNLEQRAQLERELAQKRAELEAIREEGRRAGVPAGWLR